MRNGNGSNGAKQQVFGNFIQEYQGRGHRYALGLCHNLDEACELVQEAFSRAWRHWDRYDPKRPFDSWFFTILGNTFLDTRRRCAYRKVRSLDAPVNGEEELSFYELHPDEEEGPLEHLERKEKIRLVRERLAELRPTERQVLILCDMQRCSYVEAAEALDLPLGTVRSRLFRARQQFRRNPGRLLEVV